MPEFLGRPNLPNSLANSLVQLAVHESDPAVTAMNEIGKLADNYSAQQAQMRLLEKQAEIQEGGKQKDHDRAKELKKMDTDASIYEKLLSDDRIMTGLTSHLNLNAKDADALLKNGVKTPARALADDFGSVGEPKSRSSEGTPLSKLGVNIPGDPHVLPSKEKIQIDAAVAKKYSLPDAAIGKHLTMDQIIKMRGTDAGGKGGGRGGRTDAAKLKLAEQIVNRNPDMIEADLPTRMAAIDAAYDALGTTESGGNPPAPKPKPEAPKKKGFSLFGFLSGKDKVTDPTEKVAAKGAPKKLPGLE